MYAHLKRKGYAQKYERAGIYSISIDNKLVYIGKSDNMLRRVSQHYVGIRTQSERKYRILAEAQRCGCSVSFDVLYYAEAQSKEGITEEIGEKEGEYIRKYRPPLNYQIPKADDWHQFETNAAAHTITLKEIIEEASL